MRRLTLVLTALLALAVGGPVFAAQNAKEKPKTAVAKAKVNAGLRQVAAAYLGLTQKQLATERRNGKSLAQVATAKGKSVEGLEAALLAAFKTKVEAAVTAGTIDATRAQKLLDRAPAKIEKLVQRTPKAKTQANAKVHAGLLKTAADYLQLTKKQLATELQGGKSLAQVATAHGKSVDGLSAALLAAYKVKVDAAAAAGTIDATRAEKLLERASAHIQRLVNRTHG